jgi:tight adherence protein B
VNEPALVLASLYGVGASLTLGGVLAERALSRSRRRLATFVGDVDGSSEVSSIPASLRRAREWKEFVWSINDALLRFRGQVQVAVVVVGVLCLVGGVMLGVTGLLGAAAAAGIVVGLLSTLEKDRVRINLQAGPAVSMLAAGVRAGYSVPQAVALVARESPEPTASYFARVERRLDLGTGLFDALEELADLTESRDYELLATIIGVQHETGGNLAQALDAVAETLRERLELRQLIGALTAQQRLSSMILTGLPFGVFAFMLIANRPLVEPLISTGSGRLMLLAAMGLVGCGWVLLRSLSRIAE